MKTNVLLLSTICLGLTGLSARAASANFETATVRLPTYVVTEPRQTPAEKEIKRSVDALRDLALKPVRIKIALPLPDLRKVSGDSNSSQPVKGVVVAGI